MIGRLTQDQYKNITLRLKKKYLKSIEVSEGSWEELALWMVREQWPNLKHPTWRLYRSAVTWYVGVVEPQTEPLISNILNTGRAPSIDENKQNNPYVIKHTKAKRFNGKDAELILSYLSKSGCKWDKLTAQWMKCGVLTGLRPNEWFGAEVRTDTQGDPYLYVKNFKHTNGRAHGDYRTVYLTHLSTKEAERIKIFIKSINGLLESYRGNGIDKYTPNIIYNVCANAMRRANKLFWNRRIAWYTLGSARHQFSADCKKRGVTKAELAALMGHATDETAGSHYGKKSMGTSGKPPKAKQEEVDRVREVAYNPHTIKQDSFVKKDRA